MTTKITYATGLDVGTQKRRQNGINEDSVAVNVLEDGHLGVERRAGVFVLADGAGGEEAGEIASYIASVEVARRLTAVLWDGWQLEQLLEGAPAGALEEEALVNPLGDRDATWLLNRLETAIQSTHTRILQLIRELELQSAYTTIVAGVMIGGRLYLGWVGDSRAYVVNCHADRSPEERISLLTRDHSVVERLVEQGEIDAVEAHVHREGNQITRALGGTRADEPGASTVQVETRHVELFSDDVVLFTSDGLVDAYADAPQLHDEYRQADDTAPIEEEILERSVTDDEISEIVATGTSLDDAVGRLVTLANRRGGKDNLSLILVRDGSLPESPVEQLPDRAYASRGQGRTPGAP